MKQRHDRRKMIHHPPAPFRARSDKDRRNLHSAKVQMIIQVWLQARQYSPILYLISNHINYLPQWAYCVSSFKRAVGGDQLGLNSADSKYPCSFPPLKQFGEYKILSMGASKVRFFPRTNFELHIFA